MRTKEKGMKAMRVPAAMFVCFLLLLAASVPEVSAAPKLLPMAKAGDCKACHGTEKVLPDGHPGTASMQWKECLGCHGDAKTSLAGKMSGSHAHWLARVDCAGCHGKAKKPASVTMAKCVACHGSTAKLAEKTAGVKPTNPHDSPHYGTDLDCNLCHHQHAKSELYCASCHKSQFKFLVP